MSLPTATLRSTSLTPRSYGGQACHPQGVDPGELKERLQTRALELGFCAVGVAPVRPFKQARERALRAIAEGRMAGMPWFSPERVEASADLGARYPWARSLVALAWPYKPAPAPGNGRSPKSAPGRPRGRFSAYACIDDGGRRVDYHDLLATRCDALVESLREYVPDIRAKRFVDHGWAMDRPAAELAGIGFTGKNANVITPRAGSYVMLAEILLSATLPEDAPSRRACGTCRACIPACPTGAITAPGIIDARRCISYLTIEHKGPIPHDLRPLIGTWAFGCDLCQEACPINERLAPQPLDAGDPSTRMGPVPYPDLVECLQLSEAEFAQRFHGTAVWRAGRAGLARNCAIALGNAGDKDVIPALTHARDSDADEVVREAAAWSIERLSAN
jgi:epoxyqueuosine reductase